MLRTAKNQPTHGSDRLSTRGLGEGGDSGGPCCSYTKVRNSFAALCSGFLMLHVTMSSDFVNLINFESIVYNLWHGLAMNVLSQFPMRSALPVVFSSGCFDFGKKKFASGSLCQNDLWLE